MPARNRLEIRTYLKKIGFRARREAVIKRSIQAHVVCEHFEPFRNTAMGT
jgi:hypothetical protein